MVFQYINIRQVPWEVLKTTASGLGFQHLPQDLENVNARKTMFDLYIGMPKKIVEWVAFCGIWSAFKLFAQACLSKYLG